ncbi:unnamed protein product [Cyprideis torosa]|uniref:Uncharacterized protein n=1 Tax=Cyprideis torosa TaxID=163714 RepID=A0A7R8WJV8_9CRUS|nr:unnamed protein product [Cyprideis torosa]CAG0899653.1 unnamed protein product [Cyprideis torosa]
MNRQEPQFLSAGRGNEGSLVAVLANGTTAILLPLNDGDTAEDEDFEIKTLPTLHVEDPFVDVREGSEVQVHPCVYCSHTFKTKEEHKQHLVQVHSVTTPRIRCPWENCGKAFVSRSALDAHSKNHLLPRVFNCDHCPSSFCDANRLKAHLLLHAEQKPFRCSHCDKGFPNKSVLLAHTRTHSSERPFVCPYCEPKVAFKSRGNLREHIKYHMGIKDFRCLDCHRRFVTHRDLKRHQLSHEGIQPFECDICGLRFTRKSSLSRHLKKNPKEHQNRTSFSCQGCRGRYETLQELRSHRLASKKCQTLGGRHVIAPSVLDEHELRGTEQRLRYDDMKIIRLPRSDINRSKLKVIPELSGRKDVVEELEREQEERQKEMAERELRKLWNEKRKADAKNAKGSRPRSCSRAVVGRRPRISRPKAARESEEGVTDITPPTDQSQPEEVDETDQSQPGVVDETDQSQPGEVDGTDQSSEEEEESLEPDPLRIQRMIFRPKFRLKTNSTGEVVLQDFHRKSKVFPHEIFHPKEISLEKFDEIMNNSSKIRLDSQSLPEEDENLVEHPMRISIEKDAPLQCYICSSIFVSVAALDYHILKHREKPFHCQICFNDFETLTELETHVKFFISFDRSIEQKEAVEPRPIH